MTWQKDESGAVIIIVSLALTAIMAIIGGAVDIGRAYSAKTKMQTAADSTALALLNDPSPGDAKTAASKFYLANAEFGDVTKASVATNGAQATSTVTAKADVGSTFLRLVGFASLPVTVKSSAAAPLVVRSVQFLPDTASGWWEKWVKLKVVRPDGTTETLANVHYDVSTSVPPVSLGVTATPSGWVDLGVYTHAYLEFTIGPKALDFTKFCIGCPSVLRSDDAQTSDRFYINGEQVPQGSTLDIFEFTTCDSTSAQAWEDGGGWTPDIYYFVKSKCGTNTLTKARLTG